MRFFVTGVGGQLGHDVMNELLKRGHEGVGSDIQENYSGVADGSAVTKASYMKRFEHDQLMYEEGRLAEIENTERENSLYVKMVS